MITEKMLELLILKSIIEDRNTDSEYRQFLDSNYNIDNISDRYLELGKEFLNDYALNKTEKSD